MATVTFSPLIADIRGKTADVVFASWKGRNYIRQRVIPSNPQTSAQTAVRNSLTECVSIWQQLPGALQDGYGNAAANLNISGYNDMVGRNRAPVQAESGLMGPRRNTDAAGDRIEIPSDFAYFNEPAPGSMQYGFSDPGQGALYRFGDLVYDVTNNAIIEVAVNQGPTTDEAITVAGLTIGDTYLIAVWVYRTSDEEFVHFGSGSHLQLT